MEWNDRGRAEARPREACLFRESPPAELTLRRRNGRGLLQTKFQQRFARHFDLLTAREDLNARSCRRADACADRRAFTAAGNRADNRARHGPASDFLRRIGAAPFALQAVIAADDGIVLPVDDEPRQLELQL